MRSKNRKISSDETDDESFKYRRSSMKVNLSFSDSSSSLSDPGSTAKKKNKGKESANKNVSNRIRHKDKTNSPGTSKKTKISKTKVLVNASNSVLAMSSKQNDKASISNETMVGKTPSFSRIINTPKSKGPIPLSLKKRLFTVHDSPQDILPEGDFLDEEEDPQRKKPKIIEDRTLKSSPILSSCHKMRILKCLEKNKTLQRQSTSNVINTKSPGLPITSSSFIRTRFSVQNQQPDKGEDSSDESLVQKDKSQSESSSPRKSPDKPLPMELTVTQGDVIAEKVATRIIDGDSTDSATTVRTSLNVNTSLDPVPKEKVQENSWMVRSSMHVNTSLDSIRKSRARHYETRKDQDDDSEENVSLSERLKKAREKMSIPKEEKKRKKGKTVRKKNVDTKVLSTETKDDAGENKPSVTFRTRKRYPSIYAKMMNSGVSLDAINIDSPSKDESQIQDDLTVILESFRESDHENIPNENQDRIVKSQKKRKLYPMRENSGLTSLSPVSVRFSPSFSQTQLTQAKKPCKKGKEQKDKNVVSRETTLNSPRNKSGGNSSIDLRVSDSTQPENVSEEDIFLTQKNIDSIEKKNKKKRKVISKKIKVKRAPQIVEFETLLEKKLSTQKPKTKPNYPSASSSARNSMDDFYSSKLIPNKHRRPDKIVIVMTGFSDEDKNLGKSVMKKLGKGRIEQYVTRYTTHVVSTGVRTVNLLKGIIRGCWLVGLDWMLQSLEKEEWLDPTNFEMSHFSKAVQENRKERQRFGSYYVPELFIACGFIYVENGTQRSSSVMKDLIKLAGGQITDDPKRAKIVIGLQGLKDNWILDSITTGRLQETAEYQQKSSSRKQKNKSQ